jgi:thymidylate synthase
LEERVEIYVVEKIQTNNAGWYECSLAELDVNQANIPKRAISLMWNQRSVDTFLGLPFNIASYGLLLEIIAKTVNMVPDELIGNLGDVHLYEDHISQARQQITREPFPLPSLDIHPGILDYDMEKYPIGLFEIKDYQSHPTIKAPLSN